MNFCNNFDFNDTFFRYQFYFMHYLCYAEITKAQKYMFLKRAKCACVHELFSFNYTIKIGKMCNIYHKIDSKCICIK